MNKLYAGMFAGLLIVSMIGLASANERIWRSGLGVPYLGVNPILNPYVNPYVGINPYGVYGLGHRGLLDDGFRGEHGLFRGEHGFFGEGIRGEHGLIGENGFRGEGRFGGEGRDGESRGGEGRDSEGRGK